jgi:hypothetical protein
MRDLSAAGFLYGTLHRQNRSRHMTELTKYFVGIDLHKTVTHVCVLDEDGEIIEKRRFTGGSLQ